MPRRKANEYCRVLYAYKKKEKRKKEKESKVGKRNGEKGTAEKKIAENGEDTWKAKGK